MTNSPEMRALDPVAIEAAAKAADNVIFAPGFNGPELARQAAHAAVRSYLDALSAPHAQGDVAGLGDLVWELDSLLKGRMDKLFTRDELGVLVRNAWVRWALAQPEQKPHWLLPYGELSDADKLADIVIGQSVAYETVFRILQRFTVTDHRTRLAAALPHSDGAVAEPERPMHLRGGFETEHGSFSSEERVQVVLPHTTQTGVIGEVMPDGEADFVSDSGFGMTLKWRFFRKLASPINPVPAGVGVKELEWELRIGTSATFDAFSALGVYTAWVDDAGVAFYAVPGGRGRMAGSIEAAKKASQAHFDALIRSALIPRQAPDAEQGAGWIEWNSTSDAAPDDLIPMVDVLYRNGSVEVGRADGFSWSQGDDPEDIVAYRRAPTQDRG